MDEIKNLLENFSGEVYDLCYEILSISEDQATAFEYVCKNLIKYPENGTIQIAEYFSEDELEEFESLYDDTVKGLLNANIKKCNYGVIAVKDFYRSLWEIYSTMFSTLKEKAYAFYCTVSSKSIPYQYMGRPISMSNEQFQALTVQNKQIIDKIRTIGRSGYSQRTERASLLLNCINEVENFESKVVVLAHALSILGSRIGLPNEQQVADLLMHQIDKKIEELESEKPTQEQEDQVEESQSE